MIVSGTPGHVTEDTQHKKPYMIGGHLLRFSKPYNIYELTLQQSTGGTIAGAPVTGLPGATFNLSATPANKYTFAGWSVTGATLTGSAGTYTNSDVTAKGNWTYHPEPVLVNSGITGNVIIRQTLNGGSVLTAAKSGYIEPVMPTLENNEFIVLKELGCPAYGSGYGLYYQTIYYRDTRESWNSTSQSQSWGYIGGGLYGSYWANNPICLGPASSTDTPPFKFDCYNQTAYNTGNHLGQFSAWKYRME